MGSHQKSQGTPSYTLHSNSAGLAQIPIGLLFKPRAQAIQNLIAGIGLVHSAKVCSLSNSYVKIAGCFAKRDLEEKCSRIWEKSHWPWFAKWVERVFIVSGRRRD